MNPTPVSQYNPYDATSPSKMPRFNPYKEKEKKRAAKAAAAAAASMINKASDAPDVTKIIDVGKLIAGVVSDLASEKEGDVVAEKDAAKVVASEKDVSKDVVSEKDVVKSSGIVYEKWKGKGIDLFIYLFLL